MKFTKMVGTGNDFVVIDNRGEIIRNRAEFSRKYCNRHFGIGSDGIILIEKPPQPLSYALHPDFRMRIFNPDGSEAEMCGNGARCAAVFAYQKGIVRKRDACFQTLAGPIEGVVKGNGARITLKEPRDLELHKKINVSGKKITVHHLNTGVPHTILIGKNVDRIDIMKVAPPIRYNCAFLKGTNVDFVKIVDSHKIKIRTYERGVEEETFACGTGAIASAIVSSILGNTKPPVDVVVKGGVLKVDFKMKSRCSVLNVTLEGEARIVYEGEV